MSGGFQNWMVRLRGFAGASWYPYLVALLAFSDLFIGIVPTDIFVVSAVMATPKRWIFISLLTALASALGAIGAAGFCTYLGEPALVKYLPGVVGSPGWIWTDAYMTKYGLWALIGFSAGPLPLQPAVLIAGLMKKSLFLIFMGVLVGRTIKYPIECWVAAQCPEYLEKFFFIKPVDMSAKPIPPGTDV